jgi:hypothetical protein
MNSKDLLKYALIAVGAYLIYEYLQKNGGISGLFGSTASAGTTPCGAGFTLNAAGQCIAIPATTGGGSTTGSGANTGGGGTTTNTPTPPVLDMTGLTVTPDINDSLTGVVKINGVPTKLSIITASGAIYDSTGTDVTASLQGQGIDIVALRTAFQNAAPAAASTSTTSTGTLPCQQPNYFQGGVCVDAFTGQPIPNTMSQSQQNGVAGLGAVRFTPPWLM